MKFEDIRVFVCVPAVGKTYLLKHNPNFVDMDEMKARYKYGQENCSGKDIEWLKGNRGEAKRGGSTEFIKQQTKYFLENTDKILLFAPNPQIVDMIFQNNIPYCLVFHTKDCLPEIEARMKKRGNQENFIRAMIDPINEFYAANIEDTRPAYKIELRGGEYLSDIFKDPNRFLNRKFLG